MAKRWGRGGGGFVLSGSYKAGHVSKPPKNHDSDVTNRGKNHERVVALKHKGLQSQQDRHRSGAEGGPSYKRKPKDTNNHGESRSPSGVPCVLCVCV